MAKNIKLWENTVVTTDEKGNPALVGFAKEALVSFDKMKIDVTIQLKDHDKETVEKLLKDNDVPYKKIITSDEKEDGKDKYDLCVVGGNVVKLGSWKWTAEEVVGKLCDKEEKQMSEQESMNKRLEDIKKFTQERNKKKDSVHPIY